MIEYFSRVKRILERLRVVEKLSCFEIENKKLVKMLDPLDQAWQYGNALAAKTLGRATVNKHRLCGSLLPPFFTHCVSTLGEGRRR